ncbi:MAG: SPFH domain-containing protein, partial [Pseudomonadota bacterium]
MNFEVVLFFITLFVTLYCWGRFFAAVIIYDFQKGLLYKKGSFIKTLNAGKYYYFKLNSAIQVIDTRKTLVTLPSQEILTKDNVNIKITLVGFYQVADPVKAKHQSGNYVTEFYNLSQIILRNLVGAVTIDE